MKKLLLSAVSASAILMAVPALADNSSSTVNQSNTGNAATVDQTGSLSGGSSLVDQSGANNIATVTQADDGSLCLPGYGQKRLGETNSKSLGNPSLFGPKPFATRFR